MGAVEDSLEVVVEIEAAPGLHIVEKRFPLGGLRHGEDHDGGDAAGPVFPLEFQVQLAVGHVDVESFLVK